MSLDITISLSDKDLSHFINGMHEAAAHAKDKPAKEITDGARKLLATAGDVEVPEFIASRLDKLETLIQMAEDKGFDLPQEYLDHVLAALAYFVEPEDIVPDNVPVLGYLDDAIMIELCERELQNEREAYEDFCDWRGTEAESRGIDAKSLMFNRVDWAEQRREEAIALIRSRHRQPVAARGWQPVLFRIH